MDIYQLLKQDHDQAKELFQQIMGSMDFQGGMGGQPGSTGMTGTGTQGSIGRGAGSQSGYEMGQTGMGGQTAMGGTQGGMRQSSPQMLFTELSQALMTHVDAEEAVFYSRLRNESQTRSLVDQSMREHNEVKQLLGNMQMGQNIRSQIQELQQKVNHHVQEEENRLFPMAQQILSEQEARDIGMQFERQKRQSMGRAA